MKSIFWSCNKCTFLFSIQPTINILHTNCYSKMSFCWYLLSIWWRLMIVNMLNWILLETRPLSANKTDEKVYCLCPKCQEKWIMTCYYSSVYFVQSFLLWELVGKLTYTSELFKVCWRACICSYNAKVSAKLSGKKWKPSMYLQYL